MSQLGSCGPAYSLGASTAPLGCSDCKGDGKSCSFSKADKKREHNSPEYSYGPGSTSLPSTIADQTEGDYGDQGNYDYEEGYEEEGAAIVGVANLTRADLQDLSHFNTPVEESTAGGDYGQ